MCGGLLRSLLLLLTSAVIPIVTATPSSPTAETTSTTATATAPSIFETVLLILISALLPIVRIRRSVATTTILASTAAAASRRAFSAFVEWFSGGTGLHLTLSDKLVLLLTVVLLAHNLQFLVLPLGANLDKLLCKFLILELDENRALEQLLGSAPELDVVDRSILSEESLDVELGCSYLVAETLGVDRSGFGLLLALAIGLVWVLALDGLFAFISLNDKASAVTEGGDDSSVGLESAHSLEGADGLE